MAWRTPIPPEKLDEWDPQQQDYVGWGAAGPGRTPLPSTRTGQSWAVSPRLRGLYIKNVPATMSAEGVQRLFSEYGAVESVVMGRPGPATSHSRWAIVNPHSTRDAVAMMGALHGRPPLCLDVTLAISPEEKRQQQWEKKAQQCFLEEVRREVLAAGDRCSTPVMKSESEGGLVNSTVTTLPITTTTSEGGLVNSTVTTLPITTTTTTGSTAPPSFTSRHKTSEAVFEVSCGTVVVEHQVALPCVWCGAAGQLVCSSCGAWYCRKLCQAAHWPLHHSSCSPAPASPPPQEAATASASCSLPGCLRKRDGKIDSGND